MEKPILYAFPAAGTDCTWPMQAPSFRGTAQACGFWSEGTCGRMLHCGCGRFFGFEHLIRQIPPVVRVRRLRRKSLRHMLGKGRDAPSFGFDLHCLCAPAAFFLCVQYTRVAGGAAFFFCGRACGAFLCRFRLRARLRTAARPTCIFLKKAPAAAAVFCPNAARCAARIGGETIFRPFSHKKTRAAGS